MGRGKTFWGGQSREERKDYTIYRLKDFLFNHNSNSCLLKDIWRIENRKIILPPNTILKCFHISFFSLLNFHVAESISFIVCLFSFSIISKFLKFYIIPNKWICCNLCNHTARVGHLGCFYFFTLVDDAAMNISMPKSFFFIQNFIKIDAHKC